MKERLRFSETSVLTRVTRRNIPEDAIIYSELHFRHDFVGHSSQAFGSKNKIIINFEELHGYTPGALFHSA
jgi:hypothetical protein